MSGDLVFARPLLLYVGLALVPLWIAWRGWSWRRAALPWAPLQYRRAPARRRRWAALPWGVEALLLVAVVVAAAGPHGVERAELIEDEGVDVMLVLDVSLSMLAEDFEPNRIEALRRIAGDFVARAGGNRVGLVIFARDAYVQTPLTTDHRVLAELLDGVTVYTVNQVQGGGTAVGDALLTAGERLARARRADRDQALVLITDGESNLGLDPVLAARWVAESEVRLYAIGIGGERPMEVFFEGQRVGGDTPYLTVLDDAQLREVAAAAGGRYFRATDTGALEAIFGELSRLESAPLEVREIELRHPYAPFVAAVAFALYLAHLLLSGMLVWRPYR